jgi:hypothetical protein
VYCICVFAYVYCVCVLCVHELAVLMSSFSWAKNNVRSILRGVQKNVDWNGGRYDADSSLYAIIASARKGLLSKHV